MDQNNIIECAGFYFIHNFDSGNLGHVERVPTELIAPSANHRTNATETPDYEFNMWTRPDCAGTEFENGNRTWFYFGIQASEPGVLVRLNIINLNKQGKMYNQGMAPVTRTLPGKPQWERIRDKPVHSTDDNTFTLSFKYRTSENVKATTFFAFTYPYSYAELQMALNCIDMKMLPLPSTPDLDDIYYYRECLVYSLEGRRVDLLTISSHHGIGTEREERLKNLFPENQERPFKFPNKKVIFISARVHPGETPSSFVFNGFLNLLLTRNDPIAIQLRKLYVFKMIPFLNPDGVARGHYRTDTRGVNLNRVYLNPSYVYHPTVYASRALIRFYHYGCEKEDTCEENKSFISRSIQNDSENNDFVDIKKKKASSQTVARSKDYKRDKSGKLTMDKSTINLKDGEPSDKTICVNTHTGDLVMGQVAGQVNDMRLHEQNSQTTETFTGEESSLLNDSVLKSCLGSDVHLSTSDELRFEGKNPLRPLRDTIKDSISLLMTSSDKSSADESVGGVGVVGMGWCCECRRALADLEHTMPGIAAHIPHNMHTRSNVHMSQPSTCHSIDEYREQQRKQFDDQERRNQQEVPRRGTMYFCTNCFKRYLVTETNEEIKVSEPSTQSIAITAGNSGEAGDSPLVTHINTPPQSHSKTHMKPQKSAPSKKKSKEAAPAQVLSKVTCKEPESGLYLYIDLHGHASKKGIFMYGNHFEDLESSVECMLLPRIMSLNNLHFHFSSCNFTERNMYLKDRRDGMSREGSGRVAVLKATGLVRSYTLECNYNTGRLVNVLPPALRDPGAHAGSHAGAPPASTPPAPPKYTPHIYEEVGRSLGASILDLTCAHPNSRIPNSEHRNLSTIRDWLRAHTRSMKAQVCTVGRLRTLAASPVRGAAAGGPAGGPAGGAGPGLLPRAAKCKSTEERKENAYSREERRSPPRPRPDHKFGKRPDKPEPAPDERKPAPAKRRSVLGLRKPNAAKTPPRAKPRRAAEPPRALGARLSTRALRRPRAAPRAAPSAAAPWPLDALKRRSFAAPAPPLLKKIRLKTAL